MSGPTPDAERQDPAILSDGVSPSATAGPDSDAAAGAGTAALAVPAEHTELLRTIHHLADTSERMRRDVTATTAGNDIGVMAQRLARATTLDRHRQAIEMRARAAGVLDQWTAWARLLGQLGRSWPRDQLPAVPLEHGRHAAVHEAAQDIRCLADMAAVAAVREYQHRTSTNTDGHRTRAQFDRTMDALWMRAALRAQAAGMTGHERSQAWAMTSRDWATHVWQVVRFDGGDVDMLWDHYGDRAVTDEILHSLHQLRHNIERAGTPANAHAETELLPPSPGYYLTRARDAVAAVRTTHPLANPSIGAAIADVLPDTDPGREWDTPAPDARTVENSRIATHLDRGPDP